METVGLLPYSQKPTTGLYAEADEMNSHPPVLMLSHFSIFPSVSSSSRRSLNLQGWSPELCTCFYFLCVPHALFIMSDDILRSPSPWCLFNMNCWIAGIRTSNSLNCPVLAWSPTTALTCQGVWHLLFSSWQILLCWLMNIEPFWFHNGLLVWLVQF
jgi:hypothetical protein